jgi:hypothetical protein
MPCSITDEIIDAIIQNEQRHVCRPREWHPAARTRDSAAGAVRVKPEWSQLHPGWEEADACEGAVRR